jgi:hypothetical protein
VKVIRLKIFNVKEGGSQSERNNRGRTVKVSVRKGIWVKIWKKVRIRKEQNKDRR